MLRHTEELAQVLPSITSYYKHCAKYFSALLCTTSLAQSIYFPVQIRTTSIAQSSFQYYFVLQKNLPVLLCTTKFAQSTSQYSFVLKACAKHFPILLRTTKSAQVLPCLKCYVILKSLHKYFPVLPLLTSIAQVLPGTSLYYKVCTKYILPSSNSYYKHCTKFVFPVLLCTTRGLTKFFLVLLCTEKSYKITSQYYFVLQVLHKGLPNTTLYYKVCTEYFPIWNMPEHVWSRLESYLVLQSLAQVLPSITSYYKHCAKSTSQHHLILQALHKVHTSQYYFVLQALHKVLLGTTKIPPSTSWHYSLNATKSQWHSSTSKRHV